MIEVIPKGGLCNRMRVIASAVALSKDTGHQLFVNWRLNEELYCSFFQLFKENAAFKVVEKPNYLLTLFRKVFKKRKSLFFSNDEIYSKRHLGWSHDDFKSFFMGQATKNHLVIETDWNFYPAGADRFDSLKPVGELMSEINGVSEDFKKKYVVGVHIRRTDHTTSIDESPLELFVDVMHEEKRKEPAVIFFLATDDLIVQNSLKQKFGESIITYSDQKSRDSAEAIQEALVDLYCLANTNKIIGSYWSSFSETASELSGIPLTIIRK